MKPHLFTLFIIALLPLLIAGGGNSISAIAFGNTSNTPQIALDDSKLQFVSIENIGGSRDVVGLLETNITPAIEERGDGIDPRGAVISLNGEMIIAGRYNREARSGRVCAYHFTSNATTCTDSIDDLPVFLGGFWSPDSRYLVLNTDIELIRSSNETDILIYDSQENRLINRTDDGVIGNDFMMGDSAGERARVWVDLSMTFAPNGDLYFFRNAIDPTLDEWRADLMRISASDITSTSTPEVIFRHPTDRAFPVFRTNGYEIFDGIMSISPNNEYLAYSAMSAGGEDPNNGVWIIDLTQKSDKAHLNNERFGTITAGMPTWWLEMYSSEWLGDFSARSLAWSADSDRLVIMFHSFRYENDDILFPLLKYDVSTDTLESFYDYSTITEDIDLPQATLFDDVSLMADNRLVAGVISPTHNTVFYIGRDNLTEDYILSGMVITESGFTTPRRMASLSDFVPRSNTFTSIGYSGSTVRILAGSNLITLTEQ